MNTKSVIRLSLLCLAGFIAACAVHKKTEVTAIPGLSKSTVHNWLVDKDASYETGALFYNLKISSEKQVSVGAEKKTVILEADLQDYPGMYLTSGGRQICRAYLLNIQQLKQRVAIII